MITPDNNLIHKWSVHRSPLSTVDDRFSFPPVPGYTGYVPQKKEYYGQSFARTTFSALKSFESICALKSQLPPKVEALTQYSAKSFTGIPQPIWGEQVSNVTVPGTNTKVDVYIQKDEGVSKIPTGQQSVDLKKRMRANELHAQCAQDHMFLPGYTGFIPRERERFGEKYQKSATAAMCEFKSNMKLKNSRIQELEYIAKNGTLPGGIEFNDTSPIKTTAPQQFQRKQEKKSFNILNPANSVHLPKKDLLETLPIPGYKGFLPLYQTAGEHSFGRTSKECIQMFRRLNSNQ